MRMVLCTVATLTLVSAVCADAQPRSETQTFDSNGVQIAYLDQGQGEPVLLLHGFGGNKESWQQAVVPRLIAAGFRAIAHDARGHGASGNPTASGQYGQEDVNDVVRLLDHLSITRAHIVGYSRGAWIASRLVVQQSPRVRSAVFGGWGVDDPVETMPRSDCMANAEAIEQGKPQVLLQRALTPVTSRFNSGLRGSLHFTGRVSPQLDLFSGLRGAHHIPASNRCYHRTSSLMPGWRNWQTHRT